MTSLPPDGGLSVVATQAGLAPDQRIIPAHCVAAVEQAAVDAAVAGECLRTARARCDEELVRVVRGARREGVTAAHTEATQKLMSFLEGVERTTRDHEAQLVQLIVAAVEKIIGARPPEERVHELAAQALAEAGNLYGRVTLTVHPDVAPDATRLLECLEQARADVERLHIETDESLSLGACRLNSAAGQIDASLDVQLAALASALLGTTET